MRLQALLSEVGHFGIEGSYYPGETGVDLAFPEHTKQGAPLLGSSLRPCFLP